MDEDEEWVAPLQETVPPADARGEHLPRERYKAVACFDDFKFLLIGRGAWVRDINSEGGNCHVRVRPEGG